MKNLLKNTVSFFLMKKVAENSFRFPKLKRDIFKNNSIRVFA